MRKQLSTVKRWAMRLVVLITVAVVVMHSVRAQEHAAGKDAVAAVDGYSQDAQELEAAKVPDFEPTDEWQDILPGQSIPPGLHVRLNLATGKREAKLLSEDDATKEPAIGEPVGADRGAEVSPEAAGGESVTVVTDVTGEIHDATVKAPHTVASHALAVVEEATEDKETASESVTDSSEAASDVDEAPPAREPNWNHEKIYEVLQALPEPPDVDGMDIHEARAKLSTPEFRRRMIKLWKKRQEELKEALGSLQDDAKYLGGLLEDFREADQNGDTAGQLRVLEVLEWEVQDLDKTHVFNFIGGFGIMTEYLNATNLPVRASASWLIGTAVKNYKDGQDWAINAGAIPRLVDSLTLPVPEDDAEKAAAVFEVKKKAVYGLSSLVRSNPRGQRLLLSLDGPAKLSQLMDARHPLGVQLKAVLFVHDLLHEASVGTSVDGDEAALPKLHEAFRSPVWCAHSAQFVKDYADKLSRNQQAETIQAMQAQLPACRSEFVAANVKPTIETVVAAWRADSSLDADERDDLVAIGGSLLSKL